MRGYTRTKSYDAPVITKDYKELINDMKFDSEDEKLTCLDIIGSLEKVASQELKDGKIVHIPFIGTFCFNNVEMEIKKNSDDFKSFRSNHSVEEYKNYVIDFVNSKKEELTKDDNERLEFLKAKQNAKKIYQKIYLKKGKDAAHNFINMILRFKVIEFNQEIEDAYQELENEK